MGRYFGRDGQVAKEQLKRLEKSGSASEMAAIAGLQSKALRQSFRQADVSAVERNPRHVNVVSD